MQSRLRDGQAYSCRPDVIATTFKRVEEELMDDLRRGTWLPRHLQSGDATYLLHVIEFQERSALPHLHANTKYRVEPVTTADIDAVITVRKPPTREELEGGNWKSSDKIVEYVRGLHLYPDLPRDAEDYTSTDVYDLRGMFPTDASGSKREPLTVRLLVHELLLHALEGGCDDIWAA